MECEYVENGSCEGKEDENVLEEFIGGIEVEVCVSDKEMEEDYEM